MVFSTADLYDSAPDEARVLAPHWFDYGGVACFAGPVATLQLLEDNQLVRDRVAEPGAGRVLLIDGGGSLRTALLGDRLAGRAAENGWAGVVIDGCVRDVAIMRTLPIGVRARGSNPTRSAKRGAGTVDHPVEIGGVLVRPGDWLYADADGVLVAPRRLDA